MGGAARYGCLMGVVRFAKIMLQLPRPSTSLFTRRKLLCEVVWLANWLQDRRMAEGRSILGITQRVSLENE